MTSMTAYCSMLRVGQCKEGDVFVVSGAAGATGSAAVQLAKHHFKAKRVIGIAGGPDKCRWVETLGADACVDYKSSSFADDLRKALDGEFVNVYFDNVRLLSLALLPTVLVDGPDSLSVARRSRAPSSTPSSATWLATRALSPAAQSRRTMVTASCR